MSWYLSLRTSDLIKPINCKNEKKRKDREKRKGALYSDSRSPCLCQSEARAHCSYLLWAIYIYIYIYMAVSTPGHGDLAAVLMSRMALS